jgi:protoporphyrinogen oxidase
MFKYITSGSDHGPIPRKFKASDQSITKNTSHLTILGGGIAGLSVAYYAKLGGIPFAIFEKSGKVGGNCITLQHQDFFFDSGAHRMHNSNPRITQEINDLLGKDLLKVEAPSKIFHQGKFIDFPLSPLNLCVTLGFSHFLRAAWDLLIARMKMNDKSSNFENYAVATYGRTIADQFLLGYSEKLWGLSAAMLSPSIAGKRLKGLDIRTFISEALFGKKAKTEHLEGMNFYYPRGGFGKISQRLAGFCGSEHIYLNSPITRVFHANGRLTAIEINNTDTVDVGQGSVVSTLPIGQLISGLEPKAPVEIIDITRTLKFRHMVLAVLFVDRPSFTKNATIYIPDKDLPFTRIYEPKNRSVEMSPADKTCLVFEIPCHKSDPCWSMEQDEILGSGPFAGC